MKEKKDITIRLRVSATEKEVIQSYAKDHNMSMSELIRSALERYIALEAAAAVKE